MYTLHENEVSNLLVEQKNKILTLVNDGRFDLALAVLDVVSESWERFDYRYKELEIRERIASTLRHLREMLA